MTKIKRLAALALAFFVAGFPQLSFAEKIEGLAAEARAQDAIDGLDIQDYLPEVSVSEVTLDKTIFSQGEAVSGTALLSNVGDYPARVVLSASILEGEGDEETIVSFGENGEAIELLPGEERATRFSVVSPVGRSIRGARVEATARLDGSALLSWDYSDRFSVEGDGRYTFISFASFEGNLPTVSGPFLYEGGSLSLKVEISSGVTLPAVTPVLELKNRAVPSGATFRGGPVAVAASGFAASSVEIARGDLLPGVYEGDLSLEVAGRPVPGPSVPVRVVVAGESATVHSVRSTAAAVSSGDAFELRAILSGSPIDPTEEDRGPESRAWNGVVRAEVRDVDGASVASGEWRGKISDSVEVPLSLVAENDAESMVAEISVLDSAGRTVFSREFQVGRDGSVSAAKDAQDGSPVNLTLNLAAVAALLAVLLALLVRRRRNVAAAAILSCGLVLAALVGGRGVIEVEAATQKQAAGICAADPSSVCCSNPASSCCGDPGCWIGENEWNEILTKKSAGNEWQKLYDKMANSCEVCDSPLSSDTNLLDDTGKLPVTVDATSVNILIFGSDGKQVNIAKKQWPKCGDTLKIEARATFLACENTGIVGQMTSQLYRISGPGGVEIEAVTPPESKNIRKPKFGTSHGFYSFTYEVEYTSNRLTRSGWYRVYVRAGSSDGVSGVTSGRNDHVDFYMGDCDKCPNIVGDQNVVPVGLTRNAGGQCVCPEGSEYDPTDGRCEDDHGVCTTCDGIVDRGTGTGGTSGGCPVGTKYCDGVCVDAAAACSTTVITSCPLVSDGRQYCVEIFDRRGASTSQTASYGTADLEAIFGFGIRDARYKQADEIAAGGTAEPIFGVVGRWASLASLGAGESSSGCGGTVCSYPSQGCLAAIDPTTNDSVADCVSPNDPVGAGVPPSAVLEVEPSVVGVNGHCDIYWGSHEMQACTVSGRGLVPPKSSLAGAAQTPSLTSSATYSLVCTGTDGRTYTDSDTCAVSPDVVEF